MIGMVFLHAIYSILLISSPITEKRDDGNLQIDPSQANGLSQSSLLTQSKFLITDEQSFRCAVDISNWDRNVMRPSFTLYIVLLRFRKTHVQIINICPLLQLRPIQA